MNKTLSICLLSLLSLSAFAQNGTVKESLKIHSNILNKDVSYTIYLPFDYQTSERKYPVTYLLHGYTDNDTGWMQFGEANLIADEAINARKIPPMIIVMPDGGVSWYVNNFDGTVKYEDFFFQEFIPQIEKMYRIRGEKAYRGISGLSMGGYGSLIYSMRHPEMFVACSAFSSAIFTDEETIASPEENWKRIFSILYGPDLKGQARITEHYKSYAPIHILKKMKPETFKTVKWYLDCGDDDFLYKGNSTFHIMLNDMKLPHEFRMRDGGHTWAYWRSGLSDGLKFIGDNFHR